MEKNETQNEVIYTNSVGIEASVFDIKLKLGYISTNEENKTEKTNLYEVAMSPQHAKALSRTLENTIKKYEEAFGEIKLNPIKEEGK